MASGNKNFKDFVHPLVHEAMDKNQKVKDRFGETDRWDWDADAAVLTFSNRGKAKYRIHVSIVGTTQADSWQWAWANPNIPDYSKLDLMKVREFGEAKSYEQLTSKFLEADEYTGWEMTAVAVHVLNALGSYRFPTQNGFCYLAYRKIESIGMKAIH